jgi:hypothetical protein
MSNKTLVSTLLWLLSAPVLAQSIPTSVPTERELAGLLYEHDAITLHTGRLRGGISPSVVLNAQGSDSRPSWDGDVLESQIRRMYADRQKQVAGSVSEFTDFRYCSLRGVEEGLAVLGTSKADVMSLLFVFRWTSKKDSLGRFTDFTLSLNILGSNGYAWKNLTLLDDRGWDGPSTTREILLFIKERSRSGWPSDSKPVEEQKQSSSPEPDSLDFLIIKPTQPTLSPGSRTRAASEAGSPRQYEGAFPDLKIEKLPPGFLGMKHEDLFKSAGKWVAVVPVTFYARYESKEGKCAYEVKRESNGIYLEGSAQYTWYESQNVFGAKVTVTKLTSVEKTIVIEGRPTSIKLDKIRGGWDTGGYRLTFACSPEQGQQVQRPGLGMALIGKVVEPYDDVYEDYGLTPTLRSPYETNTLVHKAHFSLQEMWCFERASGEILLKIR